MTLEDEIENLTAEIKIKQDEYHRWIGPNGWKSQAAEDMRCEIWRLVTLRLALEETLTETNRERS